MTVDRLGELSPAAWDGVRASAGLTIVSGSRTLLEAIRARTPFLYYNGVIGPGARARRHRPEKLLSLLRLGRRGGIGPTWRRDLLDFSRGRRVRAIIRSRLTARDAGPTIDASDGFRDARSDGPRVLANIARSFAAETSTEASQFARRFRSSTEKAGARRSKD